jgi:hypothetical protein
MRLIAFLLCGALVASVNGCDLGGWRAMSTAPRDGTAIEIKDSYGLVPWYGVFRWTDRDCAINTNTCGKGDPHWASVAEPYMSVDCNPEDTCHWRLVNRPSHDIL